MSGRRWSIPFEELARRANKSTEDYIRTFTVALFGRVLQRTPKDTGRLIGNWNVSHSEPDTATSTAVSDQEAKSSQVKSEVLAQPVGDLVLMCNSLPYASVIEYGNYPNPPLRGSKKRGEDVVTIHVTDGFSNQAPAGMVRVTAAEVAGIARDSLKANAP